MKYGQRHPNFGFNSSERVFHGRKQDFIQFHSTARKTPPQTKSQKSLDLKSLDLK